MGVVKSQTVAAVKSPVDWTTANYFLFHSTLSKVTWCPDAKKKSLTTAQHVFQQYFTLNAVYSLIIILKNHITQANNRREQRLYLAPGCFVRHNVQNCWSTQAPHSDSKAD